jgi:hypothetical protein
MVFPVLGSVNWRDNYNDDRGTHRHTGVDIRAPKMRPIVAPFDGVIGFKQYSFWIYGENNYRILGTHLNDDTPGTNDGKSDPDWMFAPNLRPGDRVIAGQLIGYVGNSGDATGPHLHFELHSENGIRNPTPSLKAAGKITQPRFDMPDPQKRPQANEIRLEACPRLFDKRKRVLWVILVAKQRVNGTVFVSSSPTRYRLTVAERVLESPEGEELGTLPLDRSLSLYITGDSGNRTGTLQRLIIRDRSQSTFPKLATL